MDGFDFEMVLLAGMCISSIISVIVAIASSQIISPQIASLGAAICKERYGMAYDSFDGSVLKCKPAGESYDGIQVVIE